MDFSHDILTQIGWEVEVARKKKAVLAELNSLIECASPEWVGNSPPWDGTLYEFFQETELMIDWFYAGWSLEEWRWDDYTAVDNDNAGTNCFERVADYPTIEPFYIKWQDASEYRAMGHLVIVE